jgi:hypothetical protein
MTTIMQVPYIVYRNILKIICNSLSGVLFYSTVLQLGNCVRRALALNVMAIINKS